MRTYATATAGPAMYPTNGLLMDEVEAEAASHSVIPEIRCATGSTSEWELTLEPAREGDKSGER